MDHLLQDLRYAGRLLVKSPGFTAVALLTIGIGTAANATVFGFVNALLLRPAPAIGDPGSLVSVYTSDFSSGPYGDSSYPDYETLKGDATAFAALAAENDDGIGIVRAGETVERVRASAVTGNYFDVLGVRPATGRLLTDADTRPGAPAVIVIGHALWRRTFDSNPGVLGTTLRINAVDYTVVGVAAERFEGLDLGRAFELWTPLTPPLAAPEQRGNRGLSIVGRLRADTTLAAAQSQLSTIASRLGQTYPSTNMGTLASPNEPRPMLVLPHTRMDPEFRPMVAALGVLLMAAVALVLIIACANVASLLLSRATARSREMSIRLALGASRQRLIRQLLTESVLLGIGGGTCGLLLALWTSDLLPSFFPAEQARMLDTSIDVRSIAFVIAISFASALLFGLAPALQASISPPAASLAAGAGRASDTRTSSRLRRVLVGGQVAVAVVLLVSSVLLFKSLSNALNADWGFTTRSGVIATVELPSAEFQDAQGLAYYGEVLDRVRGLPGVRAAAFARTLPLSRGGRRGFRIEGYDRKPGEGMELVINVVSRGYFETMQIPLKAGRTFDSRDVSGGARTVVVNDLMAARFFRGDAVGKYVRDSKNRQFEIVGIVQSHKYLALQEPAVPIVFYPLDQEYQSRMTLVARTDTESLGMIDPIRREMVAVNRTVPVFRTIPLSSHFAEAVAAERLTASLVSVCGAIALMLAMIGVYGVIAYAVVRRTREIGIRVALGARRVDVVRLVLTEGVGITSIGLAAGLVLSMAATRALGAVSPLYGVSRTDPWVYATVPLMLMTVAILAAWPPAMRALRVDPNTVLREE
jgi:putative ABC transport system permease protein